MSAAVFHALAFAALAFGFVLATSLFAGLAIIVTGGGGTGRRRPRSPARPRPERALRHIPRFDLAIDR